jgi:hypothetical protein
MFDQSAVKADKHLHNCISQLLFSGFIRSHVVSDLRSVAFAVVLFEQTSNVSV